MSHDAPPSTSMMDDEGNPRYRSSLSKLWFSSGMQRLVAYSIQGFCQGELWKRLTQVMIVMRLYFLVVLNIFWVTDLIRIWWFLSEKCTSLHNFPHDFRLNWPSEALSWIYLRVLDNSVCIRGGKNCMFSYWKFLDIAWFGTKKNNYS